MKLFFSMIALLIFFFAACGTPAPPTSATIPATQPPAATATSAPASQKLTVFAAASLT